MRARGLDFTIFFGPRPPDARGFTKAVKGLEHYPSTFHDPQADTEEFGNCHLVWQAEVTTNARQHTWPNATPHPWRACSQLAPLLQMPFVAVVQLAEAIVRAVIV